VEHQRTVLPPQPTHHVGGRGGHVYPADHL
jgi:hypothetical protein